MFSRCSMCNWAAESMANGSILFNIGRERDICSKDTANGAAKRLSV